MRIAVQRMSANRYWQALLFIVVALAMIYAAGEEISWGQRIFGFATPEELAAINDQSETTLHNIRELLDLSNLALLLMGLYGSIAYLINRRIRIERYWDKAEYLFVPPFFLIMFFVPIFVFRVLRFFLITESSFALNRISEWNEAVIAFGILIFLWLACTRVISASSSQAASRVPQNRAETK